MEFRTEIEIPHSQAEIDYGSGILSLGSCFSDRVAERMAVSGFRILSNPLGVAFNPKSIAKELRILDGREECVITSEEGLWFSFDAHSSFDSVSRSETEEKIGRAVEEGRQALESSSWMLLTFGTAFVYETVEHGVVANCHKLPGKMFSRRRMTVEEIVGEYDELFRGPLASKNVVVTVSPVRHVGDSLAENSVSKAVLRLAADTLEKRFGNVTYFPSFEILVDDLRDYRFYDRDMVHPSSSAVEYVWEKFRSAFMSPKTAETMARVEQIKSAASHRPFRPSSDEYRRFCARQIELIDAMNDVDLHKERDFFTSHLK